MAPRELWADDFVDGIARADIVRNALCDQRAMRFKVGRGEITPIATLSRLAAAVFSQSGRDKILARVVESPLDLERRNPHNRHGSCHGGAQTLARR
jgi:hypothetical protein